MRYNMTREQMENELSKSFRDRLFETTFAKSGRVADVEHLNAFKKFVGEVGAAHSDELEDEISNGQIMQHVRDVVPNDIDPDTGEIYGVQGDVDNAIERLDDDIWDGTASDDDTAANADYYINQSIDQANGGNIEGVKVEGYPNGDHELYPSYNQGNQRYPKVIQPTTKSSVEKTNYGDVPTTRPNGTPQASIGAHREKQMTAYARRRADEKKDEAQKGRQELPNTATNAIGAKKPRTSDLKGLTSKGRDAAATARNEREGPATTDTMDLPEFESE